MSEHRGPEAVRRPDLARAAFFAALAALLLAAAFLAGLYSGVKRNLAYDLVDRALDTARLAVGEAQNHLPGGAPVHFLQPARHDGAGVTVNEIGEDGRLVLLTGFFDGSTGIRLMRRSGEVVADWPVSFTGHFPDASYLGAEAPATDRNVDIHGVVLEPDGSVVFNYEYAGTVKLDRCGDVVWRLAAATHHSIEPAAGGGYWIPGLRRAPGGEGPIELDSRPAGSALRDDNLILRVSPDGVVERRVDLLGLLFASGLEPVLSATGYSFDDRSLDLEDVLHLNKIGELPESLAGAFPQFPAGALVLSMRKYNLLAVVDPDDWRVLWHQVGPWRRQHDPEFHADGRIWLFNNNLYKGAAAGGGALPVDPTGLSTVLAVEPSTGATEIVHGGFRSAIRGKIDAGVDGGVLVTEFEAGRAFEVDDAGRVVWEYVNRYDDTRVLEITEARLYDESALEVTDWSCTRR